MRNRHEFQAPRFGAGRRERGYTLVEIAIIVIVAGLLAGIAITGHAMLESARVKSLARDYLDVRAAVDTYRDRFRALPGDDPKASAHVPGALAAAAAGLGNGTIDGRWDSADPADESFLFWQHVRLMGSMPGSTDVASPEYRPRNSAQGFLGISGATPSQLQIAGMRGTFQICSTAIPGQYAKQLDAYLDDGDTASGSMRAVLDGSPAGSPAIPLQNIQDAHTYTVCFIV